MRQAKIYHEEAIRQAVKLDLSAIDRVEQAFAALAAGHVTLPPVQSMTMPEHNGEVDIKSAYSPVFDNFVVKIAAGFFDNPKQGLPSGSGLMVALSAKTGQVAAVLMDNGYLTDVRTAAAGGVAARHLAAAGARHAAVIGAGAQARLQIQAIHLVRPLESVLIWARDAEKAAAAAADLTQALGIPVKLMDTTEHAVRAAQIIVTTTPASTPLIKADWLQPGQLVIAMGSDHAHKAELDPECLRRADQYVPDRQAQTAIAGELRAALDAGVIAKDAKYAELGEVIAGTAPGRKSDTDLIICDLTGTGIQDTAIADLALHRLQISGE